MIKGRLLKYHQPAHICLTFWLLAADDQKRRLLEHLSIDP